MRIVEADFDRVRTTMPNPWSLVKSPEEFWGDLSTHGRRLLRERARVSLVLTLATFGWAQAAHADMCAPQAFGSNTPLSVILPRSDVRVLPKPVVKDVGLPAGRPAGHTKTEAILSGLAPNSLLGDWAPLDALGAVTPNPSPKQVIELPPPPSSMALVLSAMVSAGAWHLGRCARHLHLSSLPEWYHAGGPDQIGHAVAFDFDFRLPPACRFEQPAGERPLCYQVPRELHSPCDARAFLTIQAPRAPPSPLS